jgi:predicted nucleic acid-binding protein
MSSTFPTLAVRTFPLPLDPSRAVPRGKPQGISTARQNLNHVIAKEILRDLWEKRCGLLSTQVLQEFYVALTSKLARTVDPQAARIVVGDLLRWDVIVNDGDSILEAIEIQTKHRLSFWDALIVQTAVRGGAVVVFSEDLSDSQVIEGVRITNPFLKER